MSTVCDITWESAKPTIGNDCVVLIHRTAAASERNNSIRLLQIKTVMNYVSVPFHCTMKIDNTICVIKTHRIECQGWALRYVTSTVWDILECPRFDSVWWEELDNLSWTLPDPLSAVPMFYSWVWSGGILAQCSQTCFSIAVSWGSRTVRLPIDCMHWKCLIVLFDFKFSCCCFRG